MNQYWNNYNNTVFNSEWLIYDYIYVNTVNPLLYIKFVTNYCSVLPLEVRKRLFCYRFPKGYFACFGWRKHRHGEHGVRLKRVKDVEGVLWRIFGVDKPHSFWLNSPCVIFDCSRGYREVEFDSFETLDKALSEACKGFKGEDLFLRLKCYCHGSGRKWARIPKVP